MKRLSRHRVAADIVTSLHFAWGILLWGGAIFTATHHWYAWTQIGLMSFTLLAALPFGNVCSLTLLEERLRRAVDPGYRNHGSFPATYFNKIFGTSVSTDTIHAILAGLYAVAYAVAINAIITG